MFATFLAAPRPAFAGSPARTWSQSTSRPNGPSARSAGRCGSVLPVVLPAIGIVFLSRPATSRAIRACGPRCTFSRPPAPAGSRSPTPCRSMPAIPAAASTARRSAERPALAPAKPGHRAGQLPVRRRRLGIRRPAGTRPELPLLALPPGAQRRARDQRLLQEASSSPGSAARSRSSASRCRARSASARTSAGIAAARCRASSHRPATSSCPAARSTIAPGMLPRRPHLRDAARRRGSRSPTTLPQWEALPACRSRGRCAAPAPAPPAGPPATPEDEIRALVDEAEAAAEERDASATARPRRRRLPGPARARRRRTSATSCTPGSWRTPRST